MTTSAIRRRYGWGAGRLCIESQHARYRSTPPLLPNASSGAATVLVGGLAVFALVRAIQPPDEPPSEIQIVQLQDLPEPPPPEPPPEQILQPLAEPEPPPPEPKPEPVVVAQAEPPPKPKLVKKPEPPKRREAPKPKPKPEPVRVEPEPMWKSAPITPPPPKPKAEPPPPARRPPPKLEPPKAVPAPPVEVAESAPAWKPVAIAEAPKPRAGAPKVSIDAVRAPSSAPPEAPSRQASLPPGVPAAPKTVVRKAPAGLKPVIPAAPSADTSADSAAPPSYSRSSSPTPVSAPVTFRPQPKGVAMPGVSTTTAARDPAAATGARGKVDRPGVELPRQGAGRSQPNSRLRGVPLGSLAACRTDRLEDDLKQKVLAAVRNREECSSSAGHYRFVETKNLNAFLMWIERAPGRAEGDRCAELSYALSCLRGGGR